MEQKRDGGVLVSGGGSEIAEDWNRVGHKFVVNNVGLLCWLSVEFGRWGDVFASASKRLFY